MNDPWLWTRLGAGASLSIDDDDVILRKPHKLNMLSVEFDFNYQKWVRFL